MPDEICDLTPASLLAFKFKVNASMNNAVPQETMKIVRNVRDLEMFGEDILLISTKPGNNLGTKAISNQTRIRKNSNIRDVQ